MKIYYSRSNDVEDTLTLPHIYAFIEALKKITNVKDVSLTYHTRNSSYKPQLLEESDLVIVGFPDMDINSYIGKGCATEIKNALDRNIPVYTVSYGDISDEILIEKITSAEDVVEYNLDNYTRNSQVAISSGSINLYNHKKEDFEFFVKDLNLINYSYSDAKTDELLLLLL
jgi:hypothetical protein